MKELSPAELKARLDNCEPMELIDVREPVETEICNIGGTNIPLANIPDACETLSREIPTVFYCRSGQRAGKTVGFLEAEYGFTNLYNLRGGLLAWAEEIDPQLPIC